MNIKEFLNHYGVNTTNNFQLLHWAKQLKLNNFHVLMRDEIKDFNLKKLPLNLIVNIDPKKRRRSTLVMFSYSKRWKKYWFDSYGLPPLKEIIDKFKSPILAADFQIQYFGMKYCGQLALYILYKLNKKDDFIKSVLDLV